MNISRFDVINAINHQICLMTNTLNVENRLS